MWSTIPWAARRSTRQCAPINWEGRIVVVGFASGDFNQARTNILMVKNIEVMGFYWGSYSIHKPSAIGESMGELIRMWEDGQLKAPYQSHPAAGAGGRRAGPHDGPEVDWKDGVDGRRLSGRP